MNTAYILKILPLFGKASLVTIRLTLWAVLFSLLIGFAGNLAYYYRVRGVRGIVKCYTELSRNTPILAQLFFLYFGLPAIGIKLSGYACGIIGLSFLGGGYMVESIRLGLEAIGKVQTESAMSLGLTRTQALWHVFLPQAFSVSLPSLTANVIFLLKETSLVGAIAIPDLMHTATSQISMYYKTSECLLLLTLFYIVLILPLTLLFLNIERRLRHGGH